MFETAKLGIVYEGNCVTKVRNFVSRACGQACGRVRGRACGRVCGVTSGERANRVCEQNMYMRMNTCNQVHDASQAASKDIQVANNTRNASIR